MFTIKSFRKKRLESGSRKHNIGSDAHSPYSLCTYTFQTVKQLFRYVDRV